MYPNIDIFGHSIPTYGLMAAAGMICGLLFVFFYARRWKIDGENAVYIYTGGLLGCGVGAKVLYLILSAGRIISDVKEHGLLLSFRAHIMGGMVFYGGLLGAIAGAYIAARFLKYNLRDYYPALVPGIAVMAGFGRIGCILTGCCYGARTTSHFAVIYPEGGAAPAGVPLVPVQLYEAFFEFVMVAVLMLIVRLAPALRVKLLSIYCALYAVFRFILEFYRADEVRGIWGPFSTSQWISIAILLFLFIKTSKEARAKMIK
ncbi:MAG: prolipoprotein diacylglyceryl transferase [Saccharofermentans sp.]|nr:prolipoprotein diacylglyceryl transferase [Saccharofermentans sp.]